MKKQKRVPRHKEELKKEFEEQLELLERSCDAYDNGVEPEGKRIALSLRVLLHEAGRSKALMAQLGIRDIYFYDSAGPLDPNNLLAEPNLLALQHNVQHGEGSAKYIPKGNGSRRWERIRFQDWWNGPVIRDKCSRKFSRGDLILLVANTDGGAHVDSSLDEHYLALSRENSLGWMLRSGNVKRNLDGRPELACMRQIAYELLRTVEDFRPEYSNTIKAARPLAAPF